MERLDKVISTALGLTRSQAKDLVKSGEVAVAGQVVKSSALKVEPDTVTVSGKSVSYKEHIYLVLNKPQGVVSATEDTRDTTVLDLVPEELFRQGLFPAGRLDKDTTGFVLLTDDGDFAHSILSPRHHVSKTYFVTLDKPVDESLVAKFEQGVELYDGTVCLSAELSIDTSDATHCTVVLHEGRYHQIKRMFASFGYTVVALHRHAMGSLELDPTLAPGECRELRQEELNLLKN